MDCFNVKLQEAANMKAYLESYQLYLDGIQRQQTMEVVNGIEDKTKRAELYKKVMGDCCEPNVIIPGGNA